MEVQLKEVQLKELQSMEVQVKECQLMMLLVEMLKLLKTLTEVQLLKANNYALKRKTSEKSLLAFFVRRYFSKLTTT